MQGGESPVQPGSLIGLGAIYGSQYLAALATGTKGMGIFREARQFSALAAAEAC